jgi:transporter family protein
MAFGRTIDGYAVQNSSPLLYSFFIYLIISAFLLIYLTLKRRWKSTAELLKMKPGKAVIAGFLNAYSYILLLFAFTHLDVSVAEPASMLSMIVTVVLAGILLKEKIKQRLVAVLIMIAGAWMLFL